ncbi:HD-GYP domain-containing protein [Crateriforma conspicua]|uniref:Cyclic di-GMP phosphodiesterase response regulator RpfG n=1 Tax=Crateriforma conspicua TaxID=2527996 RepID=A0A5C6FWE1_9PLAN|nr:HD domain-containing phosphohydrolase [Crateriforma conspicua]TWU65333.1 Cyclic di-GMP phosphodiesterase response regulator RpfG [Crateriforma conspicua]
MGQSANVTIWVEDLQSGVVCSHPIVDQSGVLLLGANTEITESVIAGLVDRGIEQVEVHPKDAARFQKDDSKRKEPSAKRTTHAESEQSALDSGRPLRNFLVDRFDEPLDEKRYESLKKDYASAIEQVDEIREAVSKHQLRTIEAIDDLSQRFTSNLIDDHDQTVSVFGSAQEQCDLTERSVKLANLGMAVAVEMGLDGKAVSEIGTTGLLHDVGLFMMDEKFRHVGVVLSEDEQWTYRKHPILSEQCLSEVGEVASHIRLAVEQVHEQYNGVGFPRGLSGNRIHPYARILNVVDAYLQLILPTDRRPGILPHDAIGILLHQARHGLFEPTVIRAFLLTQTLFPLGSTVELTDGTMATVIRRPRDGYAMPVLQRESGERIDLSQSTIQIARPIRSDAVDQVRISQQAMESMTFESAIQAATYISG